jgi:hypothetical protein
MILYTRPTIIIYSAMPVNTYPLEKNLWGAADGFNRNATRHRPAIKFT